MKKFKFKNPRCRVTNAQKTLISRSMDGAVVVEMVSCGVSHFKQLKI